MPSSLSQVHRRPPRALLLPSFYLHIHQSSHTLFETSLGFCIASSSATPRDQKAQTARTDGQMREQSPKELKANSLTSSRTQEANSSFARVLARQKCLQQQQASCRALCGLILEKLPLELREMVYRHVVPGPTVKLTERLTHGSWFAGNSYSPINFTEHMAFKGAYLDMSKGALPYCPDKERFGDNVAAEMSGYFYRNTRFDFMCCSADLARRCIQGIYFANAARKISVSVNCDWLWDPRVGYLARAETREMGCLDALAGLLVKDIALKVFVWLTPSSRSAASATKADDFGTILRALSRRLERLHNAGFKTSVVLDSGRYAWDATYQYGDHVDEENFFLGERFDLDFMFTSVTPFDATPWIEGCVPKFLDVRLPIWQGIGILADSDSTSGPGRRQLVRRRGREFGLRSRHHWGPESAKYLGF
ncbi:hypothetical protein BDU57DRAFT_598806 [Ampelomyces quisqualis]|uniref:Uncharacterized protein n=1 Tax=Ampelomyces quisqualis TaxID=50730 RepID=A0A6A5Q946_AMPQU|nr:hypothetical protein BDU57DRAFT_598806 [Ampelomyces quisqualis]